MFLSCTDISVENNSTLWFCYWRKTQFFPLSYEKHKKTDFTKCFGKYFIHQKMLLLSFISIHVNIMINISHPPPLFSLYPRGWLLGTIYPRLTLALVEFGQCEALVETEGKMSPEAGISSPPLPQGMSPAPPPPPPDLLPNFSSFWGHLLTLHNILFFLDLCSPGGGGTFLFSVSPSQLLNSFLTLNPSVKTHELHFPAWIKKYIYKYIDRYKYFYWHIYIFMYKYNNYICILTILCHIHWFNFTEC